jgi:hypothetical protein
MAEALDEMEKNSNRIRDYQESHLRFHEIALRRYPAAIRELTQSLHLKIYRHQRLHFSRPQVPEHFNHVDRMLLDAMEKNEPELARHVMEFHLADAAIGITMDKDPDYRFDALLVALQGLGIQLDPVEGGVLPRPVHIRWRNGAPSLQALETANLRYLPDDTSPTKKAAS